jgi:predicted HicB family RNase H-like nuclease
MTRTRYVAGRDIPPDEEVRDSQGRLIDDAYVDAAVESAVRQVRGRGRPSLSESGESPLLRVRVSRELDSAIRDAADRDGTSRADWVRRALRKALHDAS